MIQNISNALQRRQESFPGLGYMAVQMESSILENGQVSDGMAIAVHIQIVIQAYSYTALVVAIKGKWWSL